MTETVSTGIKVERALHPFWQKVRRVRSQMSQRMGKGWDPNFPVSPQEAWIFITAFRDGEPDLDGSERVAIRTFECPPEIAAQAIAQMTHRIATDEEKVEFLKDRKARVEACRVENERLNPQLSVQRFNGDALLALTRVADAFAANVPTVRPDLPSADSEGRKQGKNSPQRES